MNETVEQATHHLICQACYGTYNCVTYSLKCILLKITDNGKAKVLAFGDRRRKGKDHIKKIRYVDQERVLTNKEFDEKYK